MFLKVQKLAYIKTILSIMSIIMFNYKKKYSKMVFVTVRLIFYVIKPG